MSSYAVCLPCQNCDCPYRAQRSEPTSDIQPPHDKFAKRSIDISQGMMTLRISKAAQAVALFFLFSRVASIPTSHTTYKIKDDYTSSPSSFFEAFTFSTAADPTHGSVEFVDPITAAASKLIGYTFSSTTPNASSIYIGVDSTAAHPPNGRASVRITSKASYSPGTLLIADIAHMPTGCGTWPALWMVVPTGPPRAKSTSSKA